jgi:methylphosphotriester-DNA--protein-cysteine methyltransferase
MKIVGNYATKVIHQNKQGDACRFSEVKPENRVPFETVTQAINLGYRKCKICFK